MALHDRFRASRLLAGRSLVAAAKELGTSPSTLTRAEAGKRPIPEPWLLWSRTYWRPPEDVEHPLEPQIAEPQIAVSASPKPDEPEQPPERPPPES